MYMITNLINLLTPTVMCLVQELQTEERAESI